MFLDLDGTPLRFLKAVASGHSVDVPGLARLMKALHQRHGKLAWHDLFTPAIGLARDGFPVSPRLAASIERYRDRIARSDAVDLFLRKGKPLAEGTIRHNPALADTFESLARVGANGLYYGALAEAIAEAVRAEPRPGTLDIIDLDAYEVKERAPVCLDYRARFRVCSMGPPSLGATTVGQILGLMERSRPGRAGPRRPRPLESLRRGLAAGLCRPRPVPRRFRLHLGAGARPARPELPRQPGRARSIRQALPSARPIPARRPGARGGCWRRTGRPGRRAPPIFRWSTATGW